MKTDLLAIGAHPDDAELGAGGTIALEVAKGKRVGIIDLTRGELGSRGTADDRDREAAASAEILGVDFRTNLCLRDGFFSKDEASLLLLVAHIRHFKPEVVICNAISDRHPDHGKGGDFTSTACFLSGLRKVTTLWDGQPQTAWRPRAVYHYIQDRHHKPDFVVNISEYMDKKMDAVKAFKSQFYDPDSKEPQTPISSKEFLDFLFARAIEMGRPCGVTYAEGFLAQRTISVNSLFELY